MIKEENRLVGLFNIISGICICITWYLLYKYANFGKISFLGFSKNQEVLGLAVFGILLIQVIVIFVINIIYAIRNRKNKKI